MSHFKMSASLIPRNLFRLSGTLLHPKINSRLCSTSGGNDGSDKSDNTKLLDILSKQKKKHTKVELKAKPIKRNVPKSKDVSY